MTDEIPMGQTPGLPGRDHLAARNARLTAEQEQRALRSLFDATPDILFIKDAQAIYQLVNPACCRLLGLREDQILGFSDADLFPGEVASPFLTDDAAVLNQGRSLRTEILVTAVDGNRRWLQLLKSPLKDAEGRITGCFGVARDITESKRHQRLAELRQYLLELVHLGDRDQILRAALDAAEELTHSQIGFLHFVNENQDEVALQVWSTRTLTEMCFAEGKGQHYPVSEAGVWVDCIHQRQPVIHNDYVALGHKKGLPEGHAHLIREATVPLIVDNRVVAVLGVGNKACDYDHEDIALLRQIIELAVDFSKRQQVEEQLEIIAYYDALTKLPNRSLLLDRLNQFIALADGAKELIVVACLDLNDFKSINIRHGYQVGDAVLGAVARRLQEGLRRGDSLGRIGGDEFAFILMDLPTAQDCKLAIQRILKQFNLPLEVMGHRLVISGSIGFTLFPTDPGPADALLNHAQEAMFQAKGVNQTNLHLYDPVRDLQVRHRQGLREELTLALETDQLTLYYQPRIRLRDGGVRGVEALICWRHPRDGLLMSGQLLSIIEDTPLERVLGEWVVEKALCQQGIWREAGLNLLVSVNITPNHIRMDGFVDFLGRTLKGYPKGAAEKLEIEVQEIAAIGDGDDAGRVISACKQLGILIALNDFGTGYADLNYFHHLPIDIVKIDQQFVVNMLDKNHDLGIVEGVLRMSRALQRPAVAEGVESIEIALMLHQLGCEYAQGYAIARPLLAEELPQWLAAWKTNRLWHRLREETLLGSDNYDLNVAIFSMRIWLEQVLAYLHGETGSASPGLDEQHNKFQRWYRGIGQARYGGNGRFAFLQSQYHRLYVLAAKLVDQLASRQIPVDKQDIEELTVAGKELISALRMLEWP